MTSDHYFVEDGAASPDQREVLKCFLSAARGQGMIVTLQTHGAEREVLELVDRYDVQKVIMHYCGTMSIPAWLSGQV